MQMTRERRATEERAYFLRDSKPRRPSSWRNSISVLWLRRLPATSATLFPLRDGIDLPWVRARRFAAKTPSVSRKSLAIRKESLRRLAATRVKIGAARCSFSSSSSSSSSDEDYGKYLDRQGAPETIAVRNAMTLAVMAGRGFCVKVQLDLHAITCPGVWLCPNGKVALRVTTLGSVLESHRVSPIFPLLFHDKFTFERIFTRVAALTELQRNLEQEFVYAELIQWIVPCDQGIILATFETNLADLLYPTPCYKGLLAGVDVDLLMEPTKCFPGIIVPKIEVSTKTVIEEVQGVREAGNDVARVVNPKTINDSRITERERKRPAKGIIRQRRVCHSDGKSRSQVSRTASGKEQREPTREHFCQGERPRVDKCYHAARGRTRYPTDSSYQRRNHRIPSVRGDAHVLDNCPVCLEYKCYFSPRCERHRAVKSPCVVRNESPSTEEDESSIRTPGRLCDDRRCCTWKVQGALYREPTYEPVSVLRSKARCRRGAREMSYRADGNYDTNAVSEYRSPCSTEQSRAKQGFYKNLQRFYKRMYKQAKLRAREANG